MAFRKNRCIVRNFNYTHAWAFGWIVLVGDVANGCLGLDAVLPRGFRTMRILIAIALLIVGSVVESTIAAGATIVAHFPFDADFGDASGNGHDGAATNATRVTINTTTSKFGGGAADFANTLTPATNDYVSLSTSPIHFNTATAYALSFWARPTDTTANNTGGMIMGDPTNLVSFVWVEEAVGGNGLRLRPAVTPNVNIDTPITGYKDGNFHHFVVQVAALDGDGIVNDVTVYYDNVAKTPVKNVSNTSLDIKAIGQGYTSALNVVYKGQIDEVWIFDGALTADEVSNLYSANAVPEPSTIAGLLGLAAVALLGRRRSVST